MFEMPCVAFFGSIHPINVLVIGLVVLIVVGPKRLPEVARKLGRMMETFRRAADEFKTQLMSMDREPATAGGSGTTDADGVPQPPSEADIYNQTYQYPPQSSDGNSSDGIPAVESDPSNQNASPYPGNEQYAEALNEPTGGQTSSSAATGEDTLTIESSPKENEHSTSNAQHPTSNGSPPEATP